MTDLTQVNDTVQVAKSSTSFIFPAIPPYVSYIVAGICGLLLIFILFKLFYKKKPIVQAENVFVEKLVKQWKDEGKNYNAQKMLKVYNISKLKNWLDFKTMRYKLMNSLHPLSTCMVNMQLTNGTFFQFVTTIKDGGFKFDKGFYLIDDNMKQWNASSGMFMFSFHEELCFPIKTQINITDVKNSLYESHEVELETAVNPVSLQKFMESTVIQKLLAGAELEDAMRLMKTLAIITLVIVSICLLLLLKIGGLFGGK